MRFLFLPIVVASVASFAATGAGAQSSAQGTGGGTSGQAAYVEVDDESLAVPGLNLTVDQVEDMEVVNAAGETIGEVDEVLATPAGEIVALSVESGGFLGIGDDEVVISLDQVQLKDGKLLTQLTEDELRTLPRWD